MKEQDLYARADEALRDTVEQITGAGWQQRMGDWSNPAERTGPTVREFVNSEAADAAWVPDMLAGRTMNEVGKDTYARDLLGDDPKGAVATITARAIEAVIALDDPDRTVHCSFGDYPAREYLWQIIGFHGLGAWDIANTLGLDDPLADESLAQGMYDLIAPHADEWRAIGVFPARVPVADDAPVRDRLLGAVGRQP